MNSPPECNHDQLLRDMNDALLASAVRQQELVEQAQQAEARMEVMVAELQHRTRNLIAVVSAIANGTMARTGPTEQFREQFNNRLAALSRVQSLLSRTAIEPITLDALVRMEIDAFGGEALAGKIKITGPRVVLRDRTVQTIALAVHELATNAYKHGALAAENGTLTVNWTVEQVDAMPARLVLEWIEQGVGLAQEDVQMARSGYGRDLIEIGLPYTMNAITSFELTHDGVRCRIELPLTGSNSPGNFGK